MKSPKTMLIVTSTDRAVCFVNFPSEDRVDDVGTGAYVDVVNVHFECNSLAVKAGPDILVLIRMFEKYRSGVVELEGRILKLQ
jgi:hypothetical protein